MSEKLTQKYPMCHAPMSIKYFLLLMSHNVVTCFVLHANTYRVTLVVVEEVLFT